MLGRTVMKKQFRQGREQSGRRPVAGGIRNPKKHPVIRHPQPAINVASHFDDGPETGGNVPVIQFGWFLRNERLLGQAGRGQVLFQVSPPRFQFLVLTLQLTAQGTEAQLRFDARAQDSQIDRLGHEVVGARFEAAHFTLFAAVARQHNGGDLRNLRVGIGTQPLEQIRAVQPGHLEIEQKQGGLFGL